MRKTIKQRRIEILKDVLEQLELKRYSATKGSYVRLPPNLNGMAYTDPSKDAQEELLTCTEKCQVCAKGAIFISSVRKENNISLFELKEYNDQDGQEGTEKIRKLFGKTNLARIEAAFERWIYIKKIGNALNYQRYAYEDRRYKIDKSLAKFCKKYTTPKVRLIAIVKNAIRNGGIFTLK